MSKSDADLLFRDLDERLLAEIDSQYFLESREFKSLVEVIAVLGDKVDQLGDQHDEHDDSSTRALKDRNPAYQCLLEQQTIVDDVIEKVVKFQHGGLNNSVDTMTEVVKEYNRGRSDIQGLRKALNETQSVLTSKKTGQIPLKELWLKKVEVEESLRLVKELEKLKNTPHRVNRLLQQKKYLNAVMCLNKAISMMFGEDFVAVGGVESIREQLLDLKQTLLETSVAELKEMILGGENEREGMESKDITNSDLGSEEDGSVSVSGVGLDNRSESGKSTRSHTQQSVRSGGTRRRRRGSDISNNQDMRHNSVLLHGSSSVLNDSGGGFGSDSYTWSTDLRSLDENVEAAMVDPSSAGPVFIRFLVRTVGVLGCEDDVERMLLETVSKGFKTLVIRQYREMASIKLEHRLNSLAQKGGEETTALHTKLFTDYIGSLLDACLSTIHKLLFVLKLFSISKRIRANFGTSSGGFDGNSKQQQILPTDVFETATDPNKRLVVAMWAEMEDAIIDEMRMHFTEASVASISDHDDDVRRRPESLTRVTSGMTSFGTTTTTSPGDATYGTHGEEEDSAARLIFQPTARHAAALYGRVGSYSAEGLYILRENGILEEYAMYCASNSDCHSTGHHNIVESMLLSPGSERKKDDVKAVTVVHEMKIMSMIQKFLETDLIPVIQSTVNDQMREIHLNSTFFSLVASSSKFSVLNSSVAVGINSHSHGAVSTVVPGEATSGFGSAINGQQNVTIDGVVLCRAAQVCIGTAMPLFAYWVHLNHVQHRNMLNTILDRLVRGYGAAAREELETLTYGAMSCENSVKKDVLSAIKSDPMFITYKFKMYGGKQSPEDLIIGVKNFLGSVAVRERVGTTEPLESLSSSARNAGGGNCQSSTSSHPIGNTSNPLRNTSSTKQSKESSDFVDTLYISGAIAPSNALEINSWAPRLWELSSPPLSSRTSTAAGVSNEENDDDGGGDTLPVVPFSSLIADMQLINTIAAISTAADWLVKQLSNSCNSATRKVMHTAAQKAVSSKLYGAAAGGIPAAATANNMLFSKKDNSRPSSYKQQQQQQQHTDSIGGGSAGIGTVVPSTVKSLRQDLLGAKGALMVAVVGGCKELAKIAEEGLAILRGEIQVVCFHYIRKLANVRIDGLVVGTSSSHVTAAVKQNVRTMTSKTHASGVGFGVAPGGGVNSNNGSVIGSPTSPVGLGGGLGRIMNVGVSTWNKMGGGNTPSPIPSSSGQQQQPQQQTSPYSTPNTGIGGIRIASSPPPPPSAVADEELLLVAFNKHLIGLCTAMSTALTPSAIAVVLSPLSSLVPRLLMKCILYLVNTLLDSSTSPGSGLGTSSSAAGLRRHPSAENNKNENYTTDRSIEVPGGEYKTRLLRIIVVAQQNVSILIQSSTMEGAAQRALVDVLTDEFERVRRFVSLLAMPRIELEAYLKANFTPTLFPKEEVHTLWRSSSSSDGGGDNDNAPAAFRTLWTELNKKPSTPANSGISSSSSSTLAGQVLQGSNPSLQQAFRRSSIRR